MNDATREKETFTSHLQSHQTAMELVRINLLTITLLTMPLIANPVAISDLTASNVSIIIPPGSSEACLQLLAVDDDLVEGDDVFTITAEAANTRDSVNGNALITILDNDGKNSVIIFPVNSLRVGVHGCVYGNIECSTYVKFQRSVCTKIAAWCPGDPGTFMKL